MSASRKKRRLSTDLHTAILSIFHTSPTDGSAEDVLRHKSVKQARIQVSFRLMNLCENLVCVSKDGGRTALTALKNELHDRVYSPSELSSSLFADDDDDSALPLCVIVDLLKSKCLRASDLSCSVVGQRAVYELRTTEVCSCRGMHPGIAALIRTLAEESGPVAEAFLSQFVSVLIRDRNTTRAVDAEAYCKLAELTIRILREQPANGEGHAVRLRTWLRQAVLPTRVLGHALNGDAMVWTPELSGLATGRSPAEYLEYGASEERAISVLCQAVPVAEAAKIVTQCLTTWLTSEERNNAVQRLETGSWSRVVLLERRVVDRQAFADVDGSERRGIECTITGAFCSAQAQSDAHTIAVLICLIRRLFLPASMSSSSETIRAGFEDHEKWLKHLVRANGGEIAKGLIKALSDIVALEPLRVLRTNHRVFSASRQHLQLFGEYLVQVRSRIGDLDPLHHTAVDVSGLPGVGPPNQSDAKRKAEEDVVRFVTEFAEAGGKIPPLLIRQMNFHRYHFRASTLPALLNPDLEPTDKNGNVARMGKDTFDEHRANLIKVMAFKRKDQAVTTSEAQTALNQMKEAKQKRIAERLLDTAVRPESSSRDSMPDKADTLVRMIEIIIKSTVPKSSSKVEGDQRPLFNPHAENRLNERLHTSLKECEDATQIGVLASDILQGVLKGLACEKDPQFDFSGEELFEFYEEWWEARGKVLHAVLSHFVGHEGLRRVQKPLQYQLFVLLCIRNHCLTNSLIVAMAKLISVVIVLAGDASFTDLCFVSSPSGLSPFPSTVFESLPLMGPLSVQKSVRFAVHCVCLLNAFKKKRQGPGSRFAGSNDRARYSSVSTENSCVHLAPATEHLIHLLRWAVSVPWRLLKSKSSCGKSGAVDGAAAGAASLYRMIVAVLSSEQLRIGLRPRLQEWLSMEYRCGWGRSSSVRRMLQRFENAGTVAIKLVAETCMFVAVANSESCGNVDWIARGVASFAEESNPRTGTTSCRSNSTKQLLPDYLCKCLDRSGTNVGRCMVEIVSGMSYWYFQNCSLIDADLHMCHILIPCFWPFSNRWVKYLLNSLDRCAFSSTIGEVGCQRNMFLISNIAVTWDIIGDDLRALNANSAFLEPLLSRATAIARAIDSLTGHGVMYQQITQGPSVSSNTTSSASEQLPYAFGIALTLLFARKSLSSVSDAKMGAEAVSRTVGQLVSDVSSVAAADVIDAAIHAAALMPYSYPFAELEVHDATVRNMEQVLSALLLERIRLKQVPPPVWIREKLGYSVDTDDDLRSLLLQWLGKAAGENEEGKPHYMRTSIAVAGCMARIFSTISCISEKELSLFISTIGYEAVMSALLPNILTVYTILTMNESDFAKERLSDEGMERLLSYRGAAGPILLDVVSQLVSILQSLSVNSLEAHISRMLLECPEQAEEVSLVLRSKNNLNL